MDNHQHEALTVHFYKRWLQPNLPEHAKFIEAELAKLKVLDKHDYENFKEFYDKVKKEYEANHKTAEQLHKEEVARAEQAVKAALLGGIPNANPAPLPEETDGEKEEVKREEVLEKREEVSEPEPVHTDDIFKALEEKAEKEAKAAKTKATKKSKKSSPKK